MLCAEKIVVRGRVQGVGFRPFIYQLARALDLKGTVQNNMDGVIIYAEGTEEKLNIFIDKISNEKPRLSRVDRITSEKVNLQRYEDFTIIESDRKGTSQLVVPIDASICEDCLNEMNDPSDFRYQYPFINCTQCGPRYTIIEELPYDRPYTSMVSFDMCDKCRIEYEDPFNRRHHAQPIACPTCGPTLFFYGQNGEDLNTEDPIKETISRLKAGEIGVIKGLGGFHLCCDATNEKAVLRLRERKQRPNRPLAVMAANIEVISSFAKLSDEETQVVESTEAPICVLKKNERYQLAPSVAPNVKTIGVMLPYTPLHSLLLQNSELPVLVMTSANPSGLPILYKNDEAFSYLKGIADFYLLHNRPIFHPVDDSVVSIHKDQMDIMRRARGYAPDPIFTTKNVDGIIALGSQQKNTFSIGRGDQVIISPHIGDLENVETVEHYEMELHHLLNWSGSLCDTAVIDMHPLYEVRKIAANYPFKKVVEVQHHHAHMVSCMEDNELDENVFGIILDGTGYGLDGHIWGFEVLHGDAQNFARLAHLKYSPLLGGEKSIKEPWRIAVAMLIQSFQEEGVVLARQLFSNKENEINIMNKMLSLNVNVVQAGTCGRLFDAVSAICSICTVSTYDGEAAIKLSELLNENIIYEPYTFEIHCDNDEMIFDFSKMLKQIVNDKLDDVNINEISGRFHETIVGAIKDVMIRLKRTKHYSSDKIVLSGGSFHNRYLKKRLIEELSSEFTVFTHRKVPCNDGGLSYGQLMIAAKRRDC